MLSSIKFKVFIGLCIICLFTSNTKSQEVKFYIKYRTHNQFLDTLPREFLNRVVKEYRIKSLTEIKIKLDSNFKHKDSTYLNQYFFDQLGQITEKRNEFSNDKKIYSSYLYHYSENNTKLSIENKSRGILLFDASHHNYLKDLHKYCEERNISGGITSIFVDEFSKAKKSNYKVEIFIHYSSRDLIDEITVEETKNDKSQFFLYKIVHEFYTSYEH